VAVGVHSGRQQDFPVDQEAPVAIVSRGFRGRREQSADLPPGQYLTRDFPVLTAGPTQFINHDRWRFTISDETGGTHSWTWADLMALPSESPTVDLHCVTKWSKFRTSWRGVSLDTFFEAVESAADFAFVRSYGGYTTNLPVEDLRDGKAWIVHTYEGEELPAEHGGPARLLVPHLYLWKSAKWISGIELRDDDEPGFWEELGYHNYGDPWREQRYAGD
jgi:DMSO/TMAO reductase YedYZ molybdopterin-dependent catalytic subunit